MDDVNMYELKCKDEFNAIKGSLNRIEERFDVWIEKTGKVIYGNGSKGLKTVQAEQAKDIDSLSRSIKWMGGIGTALLTAVLIRVVWTIISK